MKINFFSLCLLSTLLNAATVKSMSQEIFIQELEIIKAQTQEQFVYLNDEIKQTLIALKNNENSRFSPEFYQLCSHIEQGGSTTLRTSMEQIMRESYDYLNSVSDLASTKQNLDTYAQALESGQATITVEDDINPEAQTRSTRVICQLIVSGFLRVCGSATISNTLCVGGKATVGSLTVLGDAIVKGRLIVNGVEITGSGGGGGGSGDVVGPASSTDNAIALFDGVTGKLLKQSPAPVTIDGSNNMNDVNDINMDGNLNMQQTNAAGTQGVITMGGDRFMHSGGSVNSVFLGNEAGNFTEVGNNTGLGARALSAVTGVGTSNIAVGADALRDNTIGIENVAVGAGALITNVDGDNNTAIGTAALVLNTGDNNIAVGNLAGSALTTGSGNIDIGNIGVAAESNAIRIGTLNTQTTCFIQGIDGATVGASATVLVNALGQLGTAVSSERYKHSINDLPGTLEHVRELRPVSFKYKPEISQSQDPQLGLIAEEVEKVFPELVIYKDGKPETVQYHLLPIILLKALQNLADKNQELEKRVHELSAKVL